MGRTAQDFEPHAIKDLRRYLKAFTLPQPHPYPPKDLFILPPVHSKSHENNGLAVQLEKWRTLENIRPLKASDELIMKWLDTYGKINNLDTSRDKNVSQVKAGPHTASQNANANITVQNTASSQNTNTTQNSTASQNMTASQNTTPTQNASDSQDKPQKPKKGSYRGDRLPDKLSDKFYSQKPCDIREMENWLKLPLVTVSRVMHLINENNFDWTCRSGLHNPKDFELFRHIKLPNIIVAYQTPYVLARQEMVEFVNCRSFPQITNPNKKPPLQSQHRLWAKIWDACRDSKIHWFVLTTYTQWVVGAFSPGWQFGFVTPIFHATNSSPTILEWLTFWFANAAGMIGTVSLPKVFETVMYAGDVPMEICGPTPSLGDASIRSGSHWGGASEDPGSAVEMSDIFSSTGSLNSTNEPQFPARVPVDMTSPQIQEWVSAVQVRPLDADDLESPFDPNAEYPEHIFFEAGRAHGEWVMTI